MTSIRRPSIGTDSRNSDVLQSLALDGMSHHQQEGFMHSFIEDKSSHNHYSSACNTHLPCLELNETFLKNQPTCPSHVSLESHEKTSELQTVSISSYKTTQRVLDSNQNLITCETNSLTFPHICKDTIENRCAMQTSVIDDALQKKTCVEDSKVNSNQLFCTKVCDRAKYKVSEDFSFKKQLRIEEKEGSDYVKPMSQSIAKTPPFGMKSSTQEKTLVTNINYGRTYKVIKIENGEEECVYEKTISPVIKKVHADALSTEKSEPNEYFTGNQFRDMHHLPLPSIPCTPRCHWNDLSDEISPSMWAATFRSPSSGTVFNKAQQENDLDPEEMLKQLVHCISDICLEENDAPALAAAAALRHAHNEGICLQQTKLNVCETDGYINQPALFSSHNMYTSRVMHDFVQNKDGIDSNFNQNERIHHVRSASLSPITSTNIFKVSSFSPTELTRSYPNTTRCSMTKHTASHNANSLLKNFIQENGLLLNDIPHCLHACQTTTNKTEQNEFSSPSENYDAFHVYVSQSQKKNQSASSIQCDSILSKPHNEKTELKKFQPQHNNVHQKSLNTKFSSIQNKKQMPYLPVHYNNTTKSDLSNLTLCPLQSYSDKQKNYTLTLPNTMEQTVEGCTRSGSVTPMAALPKLPLVLSPPAPLLPAHRSYYSYKPRSSTFQNCQNLNISSPDKGHNAKIALQNLDSSFIEDKKSYHLPLPTQQRRVKCENSMTSTFLYSDQQKDNAPCQTDTCHVSSHKDSNDYVNKSITSSIPSQQPLRLPCQTDECSVFLESVPKKSFLFNEQQNVQIDPQDKCMKNFDSLFHTIQIKSPTTSTHVNQPIFTDSEDSKRNGLPQLKVYIDDRDRMIYVSWIPKRARAYTSTEKRKMELLLKRKLREDFRLTGLTKVLLFPPRGVHCKLIFDCRASALSFMRSYGGCTRSEHTERWKIEMCRSYHITMHEKLTNMNVKIEWSQK